MGLHTIVIGNHKHWRGVRSKITRKHPSNIATCLLLNRQLNMLKRALSPRTTTRVAPGGDPSFLHFRYETWPPACAGEGNN